MERSRHPPGSSRSSARLIKLSTSDARIRQPDGPPSLKPRSRPSRSQRRRLNPLTRRCAAISPTVNSRSSINRCSLGPHQSPSFSTARTADLLLTDDKLARAVAAATAGRHGQLQGPQGGGTTRGSLRCRRLLGISADCQSLGTCNYMIKHLLSSSDLSTLPGNRHKGCRVRGGEI
jgi:hypothetical protein